MQTHSTRCDNEVEAEIDIDTAVRALQRALCYVSLGLAAIAGSLLAFGAFDSTPPSPPPPLSPLPFSPPATVFERTCRADACEGAVWRTVPADPSSHCLASVPSGIARLHDNESACPTECDSIFHHALNVAPSRRLQNELGFENFPAIAIEGLENVPAITTGTSCSSLLGWNFKQVQKFASSNVQSIQCSLEDIPVQINWQVNVTVGNATIDAACSPNYAAMLFPSSSTDMQYRGYLMTNMLSTSSALVVFSQGEYHPISCPSLSLQYPLKSFYDVTNTNCQPTDADLCSLFANLSQNATVSA